jgi:hypothetical protein
MRLQYVIAVPYLFTAISAAGYAGFLERVHIFEAYEIDGLMQPGDRILGFKCAARDSDLAAKEIRNGEYKHDCLLRQTLK